MSGNILVSAGEASGDQYAAMLVRELCQRRPDTSFFGCTGSKMREAGVETVVDAADLAVVGLVEVVSHLPRIYREYRRLLASVHARKPELAILTDSPDFHLRLARRLRQMGIPIIYLVAPQVWAWRKGRLPAMRRNIDRLLCIFPFEQEFFRTHGIDATYIGHPLAGIVRPALAKNDFFRKHRLPVDRPLITVLPGSRRGEAARHLPSLLAGVDLLYQQRACSFVLPASPTTGAAFFRQRFGRSPIQVIEGETWDAIAHADLALAASGTVTVEAALLGTAMVTFYKVSPLSWLAGKLLVDVPFFSMVNLIAGRAVVPELMQSEMSGERLALEAEGLLMDDAARLRMRQELAEVARKLSSQTEPMKLAASIVENLMKGQAQHVS